MKIEKNKVVSLSYKLNENNANGTMLDIAQEANPLTFIFGAGQLILGFENNIENKSIGDDFAFEVLPKDGYGEHDEKAITDIPIDIFIQDGKINHDIVKVGNIVPLQDNQGRVFKGTIKKVELDKVNIDFNHPLAGKTLFFSGKILNLRDATQEELAHGHVHSGKACQC